MKAICSFVNQKYGPGSLDYGQSQFVRAMRAREVVGT
jgi:hypothetical protein